jgi:hypothetical protein
VSTNSLHLSKLEHRKMDSEKGRAAHADVPQGESLKSQDFIK